MDNKRVVDLYLNGESMREIAEKLGTNHKLISRVLKRNGIATRKPKNLRGVKSLIVIQSETITTWLHI